MSNASQTTHDHKKIQQWTESHGGVPSKIKDTGKADNSGVLRIHFPEHSKSDEFEEISWDDFFENFDKHKLDLLYEDSNKSTFHKFIERK